MGTVYVFFADGFEEVEAFTSVDVMRRAGLNVEMITVTPSYCRMERGRNRRLPFHNGGGKSVWN